MARGDLPCPPPETVTLPLRTWLGYPIVDPIVGLLITAAIGRIVWQSASLVFARLLDGVEPGIVDEIRHSVAHAEGVEAVSEVRARWLGHRPHAGVNVAVRPTLSVSQGHAVAVEARHQLLHHLPYRDAKVDRYRREYVSRSDLRRVKRWLRRYREREGNTRAVLRQIKRYV